MLRRITIFFGCFIIVKVTNADGKRLRGANLKFIAALRSVRYYRLLAVNATLSSCLSIFDRTSPWIFSVYTFYFEASRFRVRRRELTAWSLVAWNSAWFRTWYPWSRPGFPKCRIMLLWVCGVRRWRSVQEICKRLLKDRLTKSDVQLARVDIN